jgi:hypothetical protein
MAYTNSLYKKRESNNFANCRAVSIMELTGENIERVIKERLETELTKKNE